MRLTKYTHACVRLEKDGHAIVIDPGAMGTEPQAVESVEAILVTHQHFDHFDPELLGRLSAPVYTCRGVADLLPALGDRVHVVDDGDSFSVAGFEVAVVGSKHHHSHPDAPPCDNVGFLVDGEVLHPGDALTIAEAPTLLLPGQAPWLNTPDQVAYVREMAPQRLYAIHDGLVNDWGLQVIDSILKIEADRSGADIRRLAVGESVDL